MADDDLIDVVDDQDRVIRQATRAEMRRDGLRHRAVYVILRTTDDRIVVHRRADWKDIEPGAWDLCFGGVLDAGEQWHDAARRELAEEAGVEAEVRELGQGIFEADHTRVVGRIYEATHDGPYPCPDGEVVEVRTIAVDHLAEFVTNHELCADSVALVLPHLR